MFENIVNFFKSLGKNKEETKSKDAAKERLHLVLMQDRANISADFLALMKQEIIEVIKKYIDVDENAIDVRLTNKSNDDGTTGAPVLYANIPIVSVKEEAKQEARKVKKEQENKEKDVGANASVCPKKKEVNTATKKTSKESVGIDTSAQQNEKKVDEKEGEEEVTVEKQEETKEVIEKAEEIVEEIKEETEKENANN